MAGDDQKPGFDSILNGNVTRREFIKYTAGTATCISLGSLTHGCAGSNSRATQVAGYAIDSEVVTTRARMISFPYTPYNPANPIVPPSPNGGTGLGLAELRNVSQYDALGYGDWTFGEPLPIVLRKDIMPGTDAYPTPTRNTKFLNFFAITDIHITDKEAPNQLVTLQKENTAFSGQNTSIYSPIMPYTTHVLDAAIQTANALHKNNPFDFAISLGDTCNSTSYIELRWYIDVIDGKVITPSSGAHLGADTIDYQKPYQAAGLDKSIHWYQALGNHDHFLIGSFPVYESGLEDSYTSDTVWSVPAELLTPNPATFPALFNKGNINPSSGLTQYYGGTINGSTSSGTVIDDGDVGQYATPPKVAADPDRRSLHRTEWIQEFFNTSGTPVGHGFHQVDPTKPAGFACYSFLPKSDVPLKVIVLDDTQREDDGSVDIHGHGFLDATRWAWLQKELDDGQAANQLMIIAAHIPIAVVGIGAETEWWLGGKTVANPLGDASTTTQNAVTLAGLVTKLQNTPNLLMWIAGHRHLNTVKAFMPPVGGSPDQGFWQVETSSLHDFPQQFRTFEIYLNSDYSISIVTVNVDPAVADGTPAATSRKNAIAAQQIVQQVLTANTPNITLAGGVIPVPSMDPTRDQDGSTDPTILYTDLSGAGIPYNASYNAELFKQLSPEMVAWLRVHYPTAA
jgi:metallophosphoesterase (TIGR03768 family)